jgi:hypothetical protein
MKHRAFIAFAIGTAIALGLDVLPSLVAQADETIA